LLDLDIEELGDVDDISVINTETEIGKNTHLSEQQHTSASTKLYGLQNFSQGINKDLTKSITPINPEVTSTTHYSVNHPYYNNNQQEYMLNPSTIIDITKDDEVSNKPGQSSSNYRYFIDSYLSEQEYTSTAKNQDTASYSGSSPISSPLNRKRLCTSPSHDYHENSKKNRRELFSNSVEEYVNVEKVDPSSTLDLPEIKSYPKLGFSIKIPVQERPSTSAVTDKKQVPITPEKNAIEPQQIIESVPGKNDVPQTNDTSDILRTPPRHKYPEYSKEYRNELFLRLTRGYSDSEKSCISSAFAMAELQLMSPPPRADIKLLELVKEIEVELSSTLDEKQKFIHIRPHPAKFVGDVEYST
ncbi:hypothetical protein, partial [Candidatus Ichthyocystis sparus]|uniref:hypothetical protein n=1 Tax=Candidatus Ichthyocystis sparus TaxID=1561004 RepID=UPI00159ECF1A